MSKVTDIIQKYKPATALVNAITFPPMALNGITPNHRLNIIYDIIRDLKIVLTNGTLTPSEAMEANYHLQVYTQLQNLLAIPKY